MIAKMKKLTFLVYHKEYEDFLKEIREVGVVHVVEKAQGGAGNAELQDSIRLSSRYAAAVKTLAAWVFWLALPMQAMSVKEKKP